MKKIALLLLGLLPGFCAAGPDTLSLDAFIQQALEKDNTFEQILMDELKLQYRETLALPAEDLVLSVTESLSFLLDADEDLDTTVQLAKTFLRLGTEVSAAYRVQAGTGDAADQSSVSISVAQPIAENAFGRSTRLLEKITGLEVDVARHQVAEAYEDYLALLIKSYYDWYAAYLELEVARSSFRENEKLLQNILDRQQSQVALPIDVNKTRLQVLAKKSALVELEQAYASSRDQVLQALRVKADLEVIPVEPALRKMPGGDFSAMYNVFRTTSRTFAVLDLLEAKSELQVERDADALLPSIDLVIGFEVDGEEYGLEEDKQQFTAGIIMDWPFPGTQEKARHEVSKIERDQARLRTGNTYYDLHADLQSLHRQIGRERSLLSIADEKVALARAVLEAETENYSFGKVTLNDYISAVNALDAQRFSRIRNERRLNELVLEWDRVTDQLVTDMPD